MDVIRLSQAEFDKLPEYTISEPTVIFVGKKWKRQHPGGWVFGHCVRPYPDTTGGAVEVEWRQIEIVEKVNCYALRVEGSSAWRLCGETVDSVLEQLRAELEACEEARTYLIETCPLTRDEIANLPAFRGW